MTSEIAIIRDRNVFRILAPPGTKIYHGDRAMDVDFDIGPSPRTTRIMPPVGYQVARNVSYRPATFAGYRCGTPEDQARRWPARARVDPLGVSDDQLLLGTARFGRIDRSSSAQWHFRGSVLFCTLVTVDSRAVTPRHDQ
jgi:hypothetical protein